MTRCRLSVNVNKVALLRNQRGLGIPSVVGFAEAALQAGAAGITVHPRPDERHIRGHDVEDLAVMLGTARWTQCEYNIEGNPLESGGGERLMCLIEHVRPTQATLVPDTPGQNTSDHGYDLTRDGEALQPLIAQLHAWGCRVSLFMDADSQAMAGAAQIGADRVELYTEPYASAFGTPAQQAVTARFADAAQAAREAGLTVNAGHDLSLNNLPFFLDHVPEVAEVSIGHALIGECLHMGIAETVKQYLAICDRD